MKTQLGGITLASGLVVACLSISTTASAGGWHNPPPPPPSGNCADVGSIKEWKALGSGGCTQGDKKFTYIDRGGNDEQDKYDDIAFSFTPDGLVHTFSVTQNYQSYSEDLDFWIKYSISVLDPDFLITEVGLDSTVEVSRYSDGPTTVTKKLYSDEEFDELIATLISTDGSEDSVAGLSETIIYVKDIVHVEKKDKLKDFSNDFHQTQDEPPPGTEVAEPETLALLGIGLVTLGYLTRRQRTA